MTSITSTIFLLFFFGSIISACATTPPPPPDFEVARRALDEAKHGPAARVLPNSLARANKAYSEGAALLTLANKKAPLGLRQRYLQAALLKANRAERLALEAQELARKVTAWDDRIEEYGEERQSDQIMGLMAGQMTATCPVDEAVGEAPLANVAFTTAVAFFRSGTDEVSDRDMPLIASLAELLEAAPELSVELIGYADGKGAFQTNKQLALQRANAVATTLISAGVSAERIRITTSGEFDAADEGASDAERQLDRRVEAYIAGEDGGLAH